MYMQNVLSVIEHKISNEVRYSLHFKQVVETQINKLDVSQQLFIGDDNKEKEDNNQSETTQNAAVSSQADNQTKDLILGSLSNQQLPSTSEEYTEYCDKIRSQVTKKYHNLIKNAHQYLCYMHLLSYNFVKCIEHGKKLQEIEGVAKQTLYNVQMYLAEAKCMLGRYEESLTHLEAAEGMS
jgi:hypothetical protein